MSEEVSSVGMRARVWVAKFDHTVTPPQLVEEVFVENGQVRETTRVPVRSIDRPDGDDAEQADD